MIENNAKRVKSEPKGGQKEANERPKYNKMHPKIYVRERLPKRVPKGGPVIPPSGKILGAMLGKFPLINQSKIYAKIDAEKVSKMYAKRGRPKLNFRAKWCQEGAKWRQNGVRGNQNEAKWCPKGANWSQNGARRVQREPKSYQNASQNQYPEMVAKSALKHGFGAKLTP